MSYKNFLINNELFIAYLIITYFDYFKKWGKLIEIKTIERFFPKIGSNGSIVWEPSPSGLRKASSL
jgi:hypothetical protein